MKYMFSKIDLIQEVFLNITLTEDGVVFSNVSVEPGDPHYEAFLEQAQLTDKQVKELKPDVWYDFPEGDK